MEEIWKPIANYEGLYEVSSLGRIKSLKHYAEYGEEKRKRIRNERILNLTKAASKKATYWRVGLYKEGKQKLFFVHRVVAEAFIPNTSGKPHIGHINNNPSDNSVHNLEWCTIAENNKHRKKSGHYEVGSKVHNAKLKETEASIILHSKKSDRDLANEYNVSVKVIYNIRRRLSWKHVV